MSDQPTRTSRQIRRDFLDFFATKEHSIAPSASLLPDAPNLLFTNAGMNQFVPIFLGKQPCPYPSNRAANTQKCIRAGGKHNDLEDVGMDTYHHTFFEMLGNWSFGDYFKSEAIEWAWQLLTEVWGFPKERLYATVYQPGRDEPGEFDQESHDNWTKLFLAAGLDPAVHIVNGNKKDNFWLMGDTGPAANCTSISPPRVIRMVSSLTPTAVNVLKYGTSYSSNITPTRTALFLRSPQNMLIQEWGLNA